VIGDEHKVNPRRTKQNGAKPFHACEAVTEYRRQPTS
jgi:hypothetical protein